MECDGDTGVLELKQTCLSDRIIKYLGLGFGIKKVKWAPAEATPLVKDEDEYSPTGDFSYSIFLKFSCIFLDIHALTLPMWLIFRLGICPVQNIHMSWH